MSPGFYDEDLDKYKKKNDYGNFRKYLKINVADYSHIYDHPAGLPANSSTVRHFGDLRDPGNLKVFKNPSPWKSLSFPRSKNLFENYLPPVTQNGKTSLANLGLRVSRPIIQVDGVSITLF